MTTTQIIMIDKMVEVN